jgi:hypothetical protein
MGGMTTLEQKLEQQIGAAVADYLKAGQDVARAAMERAFRSAESASSRAPKAVRGQRRSGAKRSAAEMEQLSNALEQAVRARPGETMKTLADELGATARQLQVPATRLKRAGRVRTVGQRQFTRYFPATTLAQKEA